MSAMIFRSSSGEEENRAREIAGLILYLADLYEREGASAARAYYRSPHQPELTQAERARVEKALPWLEVADTPAEQ